MTQGVFPQDIFHNGYWYNRNGQGGPVGVDVDTVTNGIKLSPNVLQYPHPNTRFLLPCNQSGNNTVLPRDYSPNGAAVTFGAGVGINQPWATAGYMAMGAGANVCAIVPNANSSWNLDTDSAILIGTINMAAPTGSAKNILINHDGASKYGIALSVSLTGKIALGVNADAAVTSAYSSATVADSTDHQVMICMDGPSKTATIYVDGVLDVTSASLWAAATHSTMTADMYFAQGITGTGIAAKFKGWQLLTFASSALPMNTAEIAKIAYAKTRTGIGAADPVFM